MRLFRSLASRIQTPRPSGFGCRSSVRSASTASARGRTTSGNDAVALPRAEVERLVAEEEVVGAARRGEEALGLGARRLPLVRLPLEELRRAVPGPADLEDDEDGGQHDRRGGQPPRAAEDPRPDEDREEREDEDEVARLGRGRAAEPGGEERRHRDADHAERERARSRLAPSTSPTSARTSTTTSTGQRPVLKSPAVCHRYVTIAHGPPSFAPRPPTPTSKRPARTRSVSQNGVPTTSHGARTRSPPAGAGRGARRARTRPAPRARARRTGARRRRAGSRAPTRPTSCQRAAVERAQEEHEREQREEQEEAVHPRVDAVEEEHPAAGDERGRDQRRPAVGEPPAEQRDERQARRPRTRPRRGGGCRGRGRGGRRRRRRGSGAARRRARG